MTEKKLIAYVNAHLVDSDFEFYGYLVTMGCEILDYGEGQLQNFDAFHEVIDCLGCVLMPGIVDIHVHFRDPGVNSAEDMVSGSRAAAAGGVTTVVCQPNTDPPIDSPMVVEYIKKASADCCINIKMYGATTVGRRGNELSNIPDLYAAGVCGFTDDGSPTHNSRIMRQSLAYSRELGMPIAQHAEDHELANGGCINEGDTSFYLGHKGMTTLAESAMVARDLVIANKEKGHYHILHVSARDTLRLVEIAKSEGIKVTCEVTPHHFALNDSAVSRFGPNAKMNPPLRSDDDRCAVVDALRSGVIDCIATDHAPHTQKSPMLSCCPPGIVGLETLLPLSLELYHRGVLSLRKVVALLTRNPADIIKDKSIGRIQKGAQADLTIVDINAEYIVDASLFESHSRNTPFNDVKMKGRVVLTVCRGRAISL